MNGAHGRGAFPNRLAPLTPPAPPHGPGRYIYFPEEEDIGPHAIAFAQLMFAHAEFEREVRSLQGAITNDLTFGEQRSNQWKPRQRPERMAKLIKRHFGDDLQETEPIVKLLSDAITPCDQRNFLAHGEWWCFNTRTLTITCPPSALVGQIQRVEEGRISGSS
jgi:hypothetical protein